MTENREPKTQAPRVEDKRGLDIKVGDTVHFVYGGVQHQMNVEEIDHEGPPDAPHAHVLIGTIKIAVHAASTAREYRDRDEMREHLEGRQPTTEASTPEKSIENDAPEHPTSSEPKTENRKPTTTKKGTKR